MQDKREWDDMGIEERVEWLYKKSDEYRKSDEFEYQIAKERGRTDWSLRHAVQWLLRKHEEEGK